MDNKTFYLTYLDNQAVPIETHYNGEQDRKRPLSTVAHLIAAYKTAVAPLLDRTSLGQLTLHFDTHSIALEPDQSLSAISCGRTAKTALIIKSKKEFVQQEPSPVSSERPITPKEERHLQRLLSYVFKTKHGRCVTVFDEHTAVTYAHGSHADLKEGDTLLISPVNEENFIQVTVKEINKIRDYALLHSETLLCQKRLSLKVPRMGAEYIQIGLSGTEASPVMYNKGVISSDDFQSNKGFMIGSSGSSPGDSGCGIFHTSSLALYGIGTACLKKIHTDFRRDSWQEDMGHALNDLSLVASQPVFSYICPSSLFTGFDEPTRKKTKEDTLDFETSGW